MNLPKTIQQARDMLRSGGITSVDLTRQYLDNITARNTELNAILEVYEDVLDQAAAADQRIANGDDTPLLGVPITIKDNIMFAGHRASAASNILGNYIAPYDAHIITELRNAGAVIIGRCNMDEFAMGSTGENSAYGPTRNPLDTSRIPGGSSSGSAASVAADFCVVSIGTDTGGSVRLPASFCGLCGLYPTYGSTSRYGLIAMGSSLDQAGGIGRTVSDCETLHNIMSTFDSRDAQCVPVSSRSIPDSNVRVVGVPRTLLQMDGVSQVVRDSFNTVLQRLASSGYEIRDIELPHATAAVPTYYVVMFAEVSTNLSRMDGMRFGVRGPGDDLLETYMNSKGQGFGSETQRRMLMGAYVLSAGYYDAYYGKATSVRELIRHEVNSAFSECDIILTPTNTIGAPELGQLADPAAMYMMDIFPVISNLTGVPALSVPFGVDANANNMPLGINILAPRFGEDRLFSLGKVIEGFSQV